MRAVGDKAVRLISSCAIPSLLRSSVFSSSAVRLKILLLPGGYLCLHGLTIKRASVCFHFLSDSGNPDQGLELWLQLSP